MCALEGVLRTLPKNGGRIPDDICGQTNKHFNLGAAIAQWVLSSILAPRVRVPRAPSMLFSICVIEIVMRKERK